MNPDKVALVTGGTRGIGYGISQELASAGYNLVLGYRENQQGAEGAKAELEETYKVRVFLVAGTTEEESTVAAYFSCIDDKFGGKLTALVHNAGGYYYGRKPSTEPDENEMYNGMYPKCFLRLVERAVQRMEDERGYIVAVFGVACNGTTSPSFPYLAMSGMESMVTHYAQQLAPRQITFNIIVPGFIDTEACRDPVRGSIGEDGIEDMARLVGMKRWGTLREVGGIVSFLCSEKAAFITGVTVTLPID